MIRWGRSAGFLKESPLIFEGQSTDKWFIRQFFLVATTATEAATATAATTVVFAGTCFIYGDATTTVLLAIQGSDSSLCFLVVRHFNKTETLGTASLAIHDHVC